MGEHEAGRTQALLTELQARTLAPLLTVETPDPQILLEAAPKGKT